MNPEHPRGKHKARVFAAALGFTAENADELRAALLTAAATADVQPVASDRFGDRYVLVSCNSDSSHNSRAGHPGWLRCSSLTYSRYARSSRLAIRAPRSGSYATYHCYATL